MPAPRKGRVLVPKTRNAGTLTEAAYWSWIRSSLRRMSQRWRPIYQALAASKRVASPLDHAVYGNRIKFTHQCAACLDYFPKKMVQVDHIVPCGSLKCSEDVGPFIERLLCEADGLRVLCTDCHLVITNKERNDKANR